jgi:DNA-binding beta-propeller fold protein YncE
VTDIGSHEVVKIKGSHATTVGSGFDRPEGLALDSTGNLYVIDSGTGTSYVVDEAGDTSTVATGFCIHKGLQSTQAGDIFVTDSGHNQVVELPFSLRRASRGRFDDI